MLAWLLQPRGYETLQAATGQEAIQVGNRRATQPYPLGPQSTRHERGGRCAGDKDKYNALRISRLLVGARILESIGAKKHCEQEWSLIWKKPLSVPVIEATIKQFILAD